jgi:hypothetical protein
MKRLLQLALLGGMMLVVGAATAQTKVVLTWTSGNTGASALPACPATSPTSCVTGYTLSMDGTQVAGPTAIGPAATTYTQTPLPTPGTHAYSLVMNGFDGVGSPTQSAAATASVNVPAPVNIPAPTGFTVVLK